MGPSVSSRPRRAASRADAAMIAAVASFVVVAALSVATVGVPPTLFLAGVWIYAAGINRFVPGLSGPVSWVAGMVGESVLVTAQSGVLALVAPHAHPQWVYVIVLLVPLIVAGVAWWYLASSASPREGVARSRPRTSGEPYLALIAVVAIEAMFEAIKLHGHDFGLTWFMTGDARNQVVGTRQILAAGGLTLHELKSYPAVVNAITAVFDGAGGRADLNSAALMVRDVQAMVATVVISCVGIALCFIAALGETFARSGGDERRLPRYVVIPLCAAGSVSIGALVLGLGSSGGFLSAMGCLVFALASLVLGLRLAQGYDDAALITVTLAMYLVVGSWTFLVVVPALATVVGCVAGATRLGRRVGGWPSRDVKVTAGALLFAVASLAGIAGALILNGSTLVAQAKSAGGIVAPNPRIFVWLGVVVAVVVLTAPGTRQRLVRLVLVGEFAVLALTVLWLYAMHPGGVHWSYYATKMIWLATVTVVWAPFVVLIDALRAAERVIRRVGPRALTRVAVAAVGSSGVLWGISHETPYPFPWHWAFVGSTFPTPRIIEAVTQQADIGGPFVFWAYSSPADEKLGNFWSALTWDYNANGTVKRSPGPENFPTWASAENGSLASLCQIVSEYELRVVTHNSRLVPTLLKDCPGYRPVPSQAHLH